MHGYHFAKTVEFFYVVAVVMILVVIQEQINSTEQRPIDLIENVCKPHDN